MKKLASGLAERGFDKGDVFAIFSPNVPEYALAFHGIATAGGIATTINPLYTVEELTFQLEHSRAKYLLTIPQFLDRAREAAEKAGVEEVFVLGEAEGATPFAALLGSDAAPPEIEFDPAEDLVVMPYSSGTTGLPKGVMLTHRNLVANVCQSIAPHSTDENDIVIGVLPFFHIYGMTVIMNMGLHAGVTTVTMPRFDLEQFLGLIEEHSVSRVYVVLGRAEPALHHARRCLELCETRVRVHVVECAEELFFGMEISRCAVAADAHAPVLVEWAGACGEHEVTDP